MHQSRCLAPPRALLFDVSPTDPVTFAAVPALRAASVQPLEAIRGE